jgi:hypothetical protein
LVVRSDFADRLRSEYALKPIARRHDRRLRRSVDAPVPGVFSSGRVIVLRELSGLRDGGEPSYNDMICGLLRLSPLGARHVIRRMRNAHVLDGGSLAARIVREGDKTHEAATLVRLDAFIPLARLARPADWSNGRRWPLTRSACRRQDSITYTAEEESPDFRERGPRRIWMHGFAEDTKRRAPQDRALLNRM